MKVLGKIHEILRRRIDKDNPESDYYEIYPITITDAVYLSEDRDQTLGEFLLDLKSSFSSFVDNIDFPVTSVQVYNGKQFGQIKLGAVTLSAEDFGLGNVDNTSDAEKPVSEPQRQYIATYISTINQTIQDTLANVNDWNAHLHDYNNPHKVTWEQVAPDTNVDPTQLVDQKALDDAIKKHNESTDLTTLHPAILDQIHEMQAKLDNIELIINQMNVNITGSMTDTVNDLIAAHDADENAHPAILTKLAELSLQIENVIQQYSGLNGVELVENKANSIDISAISALSPTDTTSALGKQYPSMIGLKDFMDKLKLSSFGRVDYLQNATQAQIDNLKNTNSSGIVFVDNLNGNPGTHIFVYSNKEYLVDYSLPAPAVNYEVEKLDKAPTQSAAITAYGNRRMVLLCEKASNTPNNATKWNQSICFYHDKILEEYILEKLELNGNENMWEVRTSSNNFGYDYANNFPGGKGLLFVASLYTNVDIDDESYTIYTGRPGVIIYDIDNNPVQRVLPLGGNTKNILLDESDTQPTRDKVLNEIFPPDGTGLLYVNNMGTADSGVPALIFYMYGNEIMVKYLKTSYFNGANVELTGPVNVTYTHTFEQEFVESSVRVAPMISGFRTSSSVTSANFIIDTEVISYNGKSATIRYQVGAGIEAHFFVMFTGVLKDYVPKP